MLTKKSICIIGLALCLSANASSLLQIKTIEKGTISSYSIQKNIARQDLSGAAMGSGGLLIVDDGGENAEFPTIRILDIKGDNGNTNKLSIGAVYRDLEAATWSKDRYYVTTSMSLVGEDHPSYRLFGEILFDKKSSTFKQGRMADYRDIIIKSLQGVAPDSTWLLRSISTFAKYGGVNVEGLASLQSHENGVLFGLRSPLVSPIFGNPAMNPNFSLDVGKAILIKVINPFDEAPATTAFTLNLEGQGIRSMEYFPNIGLYFILSGSSYADSGEFSLWSWNPQNNELQKVVVEGLDQLCRPESIVPLESKNMNSMLIISENSGKACANSKIQFIKIQIQ